MSSVRLALRVLVAADWSRLGVLFQRVFGHSLQPELAEFKYAPGRGTSMGLLDSDGVVVAHCGMLYRQLLVAGQPVQGVQYGDLMVDPLFRGMHSREGLPFNQVFTGALRHVQSMLCEPLVFGYPSKRATRLGEKLGLITEIDTLEELSWTATSGRVTASLQPACGRRLKVALNQLWKTMASDLHDSIVLVRDSAYWERRYFDHPIHQYQIYLLRGSWWRPPVGVFALRSVDGGAELVDWVGPLSNSQAIVEEARRVAGALGLSHVTTWQPSGFSYRVSLGQPERRSMPIVAAVGGQLPEAWVNAFKGRIWVTPGDTDYH